MHALLTVCIHANSAPTNTCLPSTRAGLQTTSHESTFIHVKTFVIFIHVPSRSQMYPTGINAHFYFHLHKPHPIFTRQQVSSMMP